MIDSQPLVRLLAVCVGGAAGSGARYLLSGWTFRLLGTGFPWGTLVVNLLGSFLLGFLMQVSLSSESIGPAWRAGLAIGLLGGFTTYSTFNYETLEYLRERAWVIAGANVAATLGGCLVAGALGLVLARSIFEH